MPMSNREWTTDKLYLCALNVLMLFKQEELPYLGYMQL